MESDESPLGSLDDALAAAFDGEFGEQEDDHVSWGQPASSSEQGPEGGNTSASSDIDLDELVEREIEEAGTPDVPTSSHDPPAKRRRIVSFAADVSYDSPTRDGGRAGPISTSTATTTTTAAKSTCAHPVWVFGLCGVCGVNKDDAEAAALAAAAGGGSGDPYGQYLAAAGPAVGPGGGSRQSGGVRLRHLHASKEVEVSGCEAERIRRSTVTRLLSRRRLILILDLDHTLLNSVHANEVGPEAGSQLAEVLRREEEANLGPRRQLHRLALNKLWTKLRPGVFEFLEGLRELYEMHIYTMGDKTYAAEVRRLLDPGGRLFASVVAKDHSTTATAKDLDVLLSADELTLVLDDTEVVWPGHRRNLLQIERYHYFPSDLRKWRHDGAALLDTGKDESPTEGALATHMRILRAVHTRFFSQDDPTLPTLECRDVRDVLAQLRSRVLQDCCIAFSRCWPQDRDPQQEPLWQLANNLGATCLNAYDPQRVTHVVAAAGGTEKVHLARSQGKSVVLPGWLQSCAFSWKRVPEDDYTVPEYAPHSQQGGGATPGRRGGAARCPGAGGPPGGGEEGSVAGGPDKMSQEEELRLVMAVAGGGGGGCGGEAAAPAGDNGK